MRIYNGRDTFYQWDINQKITDNSFKIDEKYNIYNSNCTSAFVVKAYNYNGTVVIDVPNILLQSSSPIIVYKCVENDDSFYTLDKYTFTVKQRPKPLDYIYTQTEVLSYETLDNKLKEIESELVLKSEIDTTLTQEGKAADAKAVGDAIDELKSDLEAVMGSYITDIDNLLGGDN